MILIISCQLWMFSSLVLSLGYLGLPLFMLNLLAMIYAVILTIPILSQTPMWLLLRPTLFQLCMLQNGHWIDRWICSYFMGSVDPSLRSHIVDFQIMRHMWLCLIEHFVQSSKALEYQLSCAIQSAVLGECSIWTSTSRWLAEDGAFISCISDRVLVFLRLPASASVLDASATSVWDSTG